jgi:hypothetical protein
MGAGPNVRLLTQSVADEDDEDDAAETPEENQTVLGSTLRHLDSLPDTEMTREFRARLLAMEANGGKTEHPRPNLPVSTGANEFHATGPLPKPAPRSEYEGVGEGLSDAQRHDHPKYGPGQRMTTAAPAFRHGPLIK